MKVFAMDLSLFIAVIGIFPVWFLIYWFWMRYQDKKESQ